MVALEALGAVVAGVATEGRDLHDIARVRGVDELVAADVDAHVPQTVEEDEVAGLDLVAGHVRAVVPDRGGVVRKRNPDLRVDEADEARAVEPLRRTRSAPHVGDAEVLERDRDDVSVLGGREVRVVLRNRSRRVARRHLLSSGHSRLLRREGRCRPSPRLGGELGLSAPLLGLHPLDLVLDRGEQLLALGQLRLDRCLLRRPLGDLLGLLGARVLELVAVLVNLAAILAYLREDPRVLARHALDRVDPGDDVVQALRAEKHLERGVAVAVHVDVAETLGDAGLRDVQALARGDEMACVDVELTVDAIELDVRVVVGLDRDRQARVEVLQLADDGLRLRLLVLDVRVGGGRSRGKQKRPGECRDEHDLRRPSGCRAPTLAPAPPPNSPAGGGLARHKSRSLAPFPDARNRKPSRKSLQMTYSTGAGIDDVFRFAPSWSGSEDGGPLLAAVLRAVVS